MLAQLGQPPAARLVPQMFDTGLEFLGSAGRLDRTFEMAGVDGGRTTGVSIEDVRSLITRRLQAG
ncbi:hypothetical protein [Nocardia brasiliensis]|uniref:hypothetical protein n=1 Tax=Nocardia brasiliensis TaxID=37326 RepID=UPI001E4EBA5E|nr:hypothetical protein [Nocardia brasiliensis]